MVKKTILTTDYDKVDGKEDNDEEMAGSGRLVLKKVGGGT